MAAWMLCSCSSHGRRTSCGRTAGAGLAGASAPCEEASCGAERECPHGVLERPAHAPGGLQHS
jgi:hypothetical protein